ncbi:MAG: OstA-like protein [Bacteroidota bacterium]
MPLHAQIISKPIDPNDTTAQKRLRILNATYLSYTQTDTLPVQKLIGKVQMQQDSTLFFCDSAYFYETENKIEAFGRVRIEMSDSVFLYGDRLAYDGATRIAEVYDKILLTNQKSDLTTDRLTYYREEDYGYYSGGGELEDGENILTSAFGYYYPNQNEAFFKEEVVLTHPDYVLRTDTLGYRTDTKIAEFLTYTLIDSKDGLLETTSGIYDTEASKVDLFERPILRDSSYTMIADTIIYIDQENIGFAKGDLLIEQEDSSLQIRGNYGQFNRQTDESVVAQSPVAIQLFDEDTLYIFADTLAALKAQVITEEKGEMEPPLVDSTQLDTTQADTVAGTGVNDSLVGPAPFVPIEYDTSEIRLFRAYRSVQFFMTDMQGRCDSMVYFYDDSTIYLFGQPVIWSEQGQLTGDTIKIWMVDNQPDSMWIGNSGFLVSEEDTIGFNQVKGKEIRAKFKDGDLHYLHVIGNGESIYFVPDDSDTVNVSYQGMNKALAQEMFLYFQENELQRIVFKTKPEGSYAPIHEVIFKENKLDGMPWRIDEKPLKPDILAKEQPSIPVLQKLEADPEDDG